ncbi:glutamate-1-semialdehyde 2,1-aminomutase [Anaerohalosphaera lusitana]|uniref:glutamate-1-semialdehyde 2,1-aminomutase n=1 Tax=Anaerohalosphaera lusitana TaxID=1936003 RepID=UPI0011BA618F
MTTSKRLFRNAQKYIPGGVNSPVRALNAVGGQPIFIDKAKGPYLYDADGNRFIDYCLSWGPMILGHAYKPVLDAVRKTLGKGTSFGIPTEIETQLAKTIATAVPSIDKVRLVSSGTEAVMTAVRLARGTTDRDIIVKFIGCYHGHVDHMLVSAGSGLATFGSPSSPGVPDDFAKNTLLLPYNDLDAAKELFKKQGKNIAAVIIEPIAGNMGTIPPAEGFLEGLRTLCSKNKSMLIFDEVITGFRFTFSGVQKMLKVQPDLTCMGKIIGGGFPVGAVGGPAAVMDNLSPDGTIYQAGTLSGNPVCVSAGLATLQALKAEKPYKKLGDSGRKLADGIDEILTAKSIPHTINRMGGMFTLFFNDEPVTDYDGAAACDTKMYAKYFQHMTANGIYVPPSQFEANFLSTTHTDRHIEQTLKAVRSFEPK